MSAKSSKKGKDLKLLLLGDSRVGKTTLLLKYFKGEFIVNLDITYSGVNYFIKQIEIPNSEPTTYTVNVWDIAGSEKYFDYFSLMASKMNGIIILSSSESRDVVEYSVQKWIAIINNYVQTDFLKFLIVVKRNNQDFVMDQKFNDLLDQSNIKKAFVLDINNDQSVSSAFDAIFSTTIESIPK